MNKRAVLYARVSAEDRSRDGRNLAGQLDMCRQHALAHGWTVVAELAEDDRGASGVSFELLQLNRVYEMAQAGEFDVLVVREIDRLSRSLAKQLIVEEELKRYGVQIEYVLGEYPDTPEGSLMKNVKASIAEYERLKITERMVRGRRQKARAGNVVLHGKIPYGYRPENGDGKSSLVIYEPEAQVVRMIFTWYTRGENGNEPLSIHGIARELSRLKIPTPYDGRKNRIKIRGYGEWSSSVVSRFLNNETYAGVWYYGKTKFVRKKANRNPDDYLIPVSVPAIVDRETWTRAQERREENRQRARRPPRFSYLLTGHLRCGLCGYRVNGRTTRRTEPKVYQYYFCPGRGSRNSARKCTLPPFRVDKVDAAVWEWIKSFLADPATLVEGLNTYRAGLDEQNVPLRWRLSVVDELLTADREQLDRLLDLYLVGDFPKETLIERKDRLEATIRALESEQAGLSAQLKAQTLTEEQIEEMQRFAADVAEGLQAAEEDLQIRRSIIEMLDLQVTLAEESGQKVIYARCMLGEEELSLSSHST